MSSAFFSLRHGHSPRSLIFGGAALPPPSAAPQSVMEVQPGGSMRMVLVLRLQRCGGDLLPGFFASTHAISGASFASSGSESVFRPSVLLLRDSRRVPLCSVSFPGHAPISLLLWEVSVRGCRQIRLLVFALCRSHHPSISALSRLEIARFFGLCLR